MFKSSHVLCKVDDLHQAVNDFEEMGFFVQWGGPPEKAANALIWFETGPFIELIDTNKAQPPAFMSWILRLFSPKGMMKRFDQWQNQKEGWCEIALETHDLDVKPFVRDLRHQGLKISGPFENKRTPPNETQITTQTAFPHNVQLPILMGAYRPQPRPTSISHPNGSVSIEKIVIGVHQDDQAQWEHLLDKNDAWTCLNNGAFGIQSVSLNGLRGPLNSSLTHGVVIFPADVTAS